MSIRSRLFLLVLAAISLPTFLVALRFFIHRHEAIDAAVGNLSVAANDFAAELNERILGTVQLEYGLARARDLEGSDRAACSAFLSAVREEYPQYTGILTINPDGQLFCDSLRTGRELDLRDRKYFREALLLPSGVALEPVFGRLSGTSVLQIAYPARTPAGELRFVLLASLNLEKFVKDYASRGLDTLLVASDGTVLAGSPAESARHPKGSSIVNDPLFVFAAEQSQGGAEEATTVIDRKVWAVAGPQALRAAGLHVLIGQAEADLVAAANDRFLEEMFVLAVVALFLFLGVWLLAEFGIRRQVTRIGTMARQLGRGDLQARIPPPHPRGELGGLMTVLNAMAASLERQQASIEDLNQKLRHSQKMQVVGQLTGGVAHDFNNILMVIMANADALEEEESLGPQLRERLEAISSATQRAADLTRQLLAFSRKQPLQPQPTNVNDLAATTGRLLRRTLGEQIEIDFIFADDLWNVEVDRAQLDSALVNLSLNARDAMPGGGRLLIETANATLDEDYAATHLEAVAGQYVMLAVTDTGEGIPPDHLDRVFEPFFSTKEVGKGSGLGLSMVYGFIAQSHGHIRIDSEVGRGTSVRLYLPRWEGNRQDTPAPQHLPMSGGHEHILVTEDDSRVRASLVHQLQSLGYTVAEASDGAAALAAFEAASRHFDLLLTDVIMPGPLNGKALADEVSRRYPATRIVFMSGYSENAFVHDGRLEAGVLLLSKPFRKGDLARILRQALERPVGPVP